MVGVQKGQIKKLLILETLPMPIHYTGGMQPITLNGSFTIERLEEAGRVVPRDPGQRRELDIFDPAPGSPAPDHLGLVQPGDRLRQRVVIRVARRSDRRLDARFRKMLGVANGQVLGGFRRSSQHPGRGSCDDSVKAACFNPIWVGSATIARPSLGGTARGAAAVLVRDSAGVLEWVACYNTSRRHEPLEDVPPAEFEEAFYHRQATPAEPVALT